MPRSTYDKLNQVKVRLSPPHKPATLEELAEFMACDTRTVYRYIHTLEKENCGLKCEKTSPHRFFIQPVAAKRPEAIIRGLKSAQKVLENMGTQPYGKSVKKAIDYLCGDALNEAEIINHAMNLDNDFIIDLGPFSEYSENNDFRATEIDKFLEAIKTRSKLSIVYNAGYNGKTETVEICPLKVVLRVDTLYLIAGTDAGIKNYSVKRIKSFRKTGAFFPPVEFDYKNLFKGCFGKFSASASDIYPKIKLVMTVENPWLEAQFREAHFNPPVKIRKQSPMVVEMNILDTPDLESWLLGVLPYVKIQEPESIKEKLRNLLKKSSEAL